MSEKPKLARQLGLFDATMLVMGGIIGSGIFMNPSVVAQQVHTPALIIGAWLVGAAVGLLGAFIWAELGATLPAVGGQYAYLREAFHPIFGFLYGWVLLLVIQTGGMAAVSIIFARYLRELLSIQTPDWLIALVALASLTTINCLGLRLGARTQSLLMVTKIVAIAALVLFGLFARSAISPPAAGHDSLSDFGAALVPVLFAYGGWQTTNFVAGEIFEPRRNLPRALLVGVAAVALLYTLVNVVSLRVLGADTLRSTSTPASEVMRIAFGRPGANFIAAAIAISALGFLAQSILTAPRVYFAMANDGLFFRGVARVSPRTHVPIIAIVVQSGWTMVIALSGRYEQILNYVVSMDFLFFGLTAATLFVFRKRDLRAARTPFHPWTTGAFIFVSWAVVANAIWRYPANTLIGMSILLAGVPVYFLWARQRA